MRRSSSTCGEVQYGRLLRLRDGAEGRQLRLYPKVYEDYCTHFEAYNDVTTLESHVYFYGLRKGEETVLKVSEGRSILIKFVGMSDPDKDGYRTLTFEVNGILREQKVLDKTLESWKTAS